MKRQLTAREWFLLGLLAVVALAGGYFLLFYTPMTAERDSALADAELYREQAAAAQSRVEEKRRMERELEDIFARSENPVGLAPYDNLQPVMMELHEILSAAGDYSLSFGTVDREESVVRRSISLSFSAGSYGGAEAILQKLHDSAYRCMLDSVTIASGEARGDPVTVNAAIVFFEYQ